MTKSELIEKVVQSHGMLNGKVSEIVVNTVFDSIEEALKSGDKVEIRGFGSFINKKRKKKIARNISRNTAIVIDEHYIPSFKPAKIFVNKIKNSDKVKQMAEKN